eukprot:TRINITY_DN8023_c0_g1_i7.p1 TRINITY_DN8023_c0_g1~~TRINITY_DN8023_c0_g1_i7.p1  ORF type:complete len:327 (+),score=28.46 TRINITY_DN8023_c0_g1_i7:112-1092(+)
MIRRPPRSTQGVSSAASDVYKRQDSLKLTVSMDGPGLVYYLGFMPHELEKIEFAELSDSSKAATKEITCPNCLGPASNLICQNNRMLRVLSSVREYFCDCENPFSFQESISRCVPITANSGNPDCAKGHNFLNDSLCYADCKYSNISTFDGEFVSCANNTPTTNTSSGRRPRYEIANFVNFYDQYYNSLHKNQISSPEESFADKLNRGVVTAIIVLGSICVFVLLIGLIMLSKYYNYFCFSKKGSAQIHEEPYGVQVELKDKIHPGMECRLCARSGLNIAILLPCGHSGVCVECTQKIQVCPFDRNQISGWAPAFKDDIENSPQNH